MTLPKNNPLFYDDVIVAKYPHKTPNDIYEFRKKKYVESLLTFVLIGSLLALYSLL
jgi:hypothetical protein